MVDWLMKHVCFGSKYTTANSPCSRPTNFPSSLSQLFLHWTFLFQICLASPDLLGTVAQMKWLKCSSEWIRRPCGLSVFICSESRALKTYLISQLLTVSVGSYSNTVFCFGCFTWQTSVFLFFSAVFLICYKKVILISTSQDSPTFEPDDSWWIVAHFLKINLTWIFASLVI